MSKSIMLFFCFGIFYHLSIAQHTISLNGVVVDENNKPLSGASVVLHPTNLGTVTNESGNFVFPALQTGNYTIEISFVGYNNFVDSLKLYNNKTYSAQLNVAHLNLQEVVITDNYVEKREREESLNIEIVNDSYVKQNLGGSLMNSLERLPGVTTIEIGSGQSKPVIRGLGFNRVVVVENSIKHEAQQWGADHGLEIDPYAVDNVEVIKGPASLVYGSDAIGGVIDMKTRKLPVKNTFGGTVDLTAKTNNELFGSSLLLYASRDWFFAKMRATYTNYGDYKVPTDSVNIYSYQAALFKNQLRNTAGYEKNMHLTFGIIQNRFQSKFNLSTINSKSGFFANAHGLEPRNVDTQLHDTSSRDVNYPYQKVHHFKLINSTNYQWEKTKLELNLGFQRNFRQELSQYVSHGFMPAVFPDSLHFSSDLEREFDKFVYSANSKISHHLSQNTRLEFGLNGECQDNKIGGRGFIIPEFKQFSWGTFALARHNFSEKSRIQLGIRYDFGNIKTSEYFDWFSSPLNENGSQDYLKRVENINRNFSNFTWSIGYNYNPANWSFKSNVGKSFRIPIAKELAANGVNYHRFSYEIGNAELSPEISYQLDAGIEYHAKRFAIGTTPFVNYFSNYIYLNPSSEFDRLYGNGNQKYYYTESEVLRFGGEIHAHYELLKNLQLGVIGEFVYSEQLSGNKKGFTLPFSPPASAILNVKYQKRKLAFIENPYFSFDYRITADQKNVVPPEEPTDGFQIVNLRFGGDFTTAKQKVNITMQVQNLFNKKYFNHTSFYRLINVPEPGRNFIVNVSVPFSGSFNHN